MSGRAKRELLFSLVRIDDPDQPGGELWRGDLRAERPYTGTSLGVVYGGSELEVLTNLLDDLSPGDILTSHDAEIRAQAQAKEALMALTSKVQAESGGLTPCDHCGKPTRKQDEAAERAACGVTAEEGP